MTTYKPIHKFVGKYGSMHYRYLMDAQSDLIDNLLKENKLDDYLETINNQAMNLRENIFEQLKIKHNLDSYIKSDYLEYMRLLNTIETIAEEIVLNDIVYI